MLNRSVFGKRPGLNAFIKQRQDRAKQNMDTLRLCRKLLRCPNPEARL